MKKNTPSGFAFFSVFKFFIFLSFLNLGSLYSQNLITNGGAETPVIAPWVTGPVIETDTDSDKDDGDWNQHGAAADVKEPFEGEYYFFSGKNNTVWLHQAIAVDDYLPNINRGFLNYSFSGRFANHEGNDEGDIRLYFYETTGSGTDRVQHNQWFQLRGDENLGYDSDYEFSAKNSASSWDTIESKGLVHSNTNTVYVELYGNKEGTTDDGRDNDAYFDDVQFYIENKVKQQVTHDGYVYMSTGDNIVRISSENYNSSTSGVETYNNYSVRNSNVEGVAVYKNETYSTVWYDGKKYLAKINYVSSFYGYELERLSALEFEQDSGDFNTSILKVIDDVLYLGQLEGISKIPKVYKIDPSTNSKEEIFSENENVGTSSFFFDIVDGYVYYIRDKELRKKNLNDANSISVKVTDLGDDYINFHNIVSDGLIFYVGAYNEKEDHGAILKVDLKNNNTSVSEEIKLDSKVQGYPSYILGDVLYYATDYDIVNTHNLIAVEVPSIQGVSVEKDSDDCKTIVSWSEPNVYYALSHEYINLYRDGELVLENFSAHTGVNQFIDTNITAGVDYNYTIENVLRDFRGITQEKKGSLTSKINFKINLLEAPSNLQVEESSTCDGGVSVTWSYSNNPVGFVLERKLESELEFTELTAVIAGSERTYKDDSAVQGLTYMYRLAAKDTDANCGVKGIVSEEKTFFNGDVDISGVFNNLNYGLEVSKGYFSAQTELQWVPETDIEAKIDQYKIYTRELGSTSTPRLLQTLDIKERSYDDEKGEAGVLYEYFIIGERVVDNVCGRMITSSYDINNLEGKETPSLEELTGVAYDVGFRVATGIVNGNISYTGGVAVNNVKVIAERESGITGNSLVLDGIDDYGTIAHNDILVPDSGNISISIWVKPTNFLGAQTILDKPNAYSLTLDAVGIVQFTIVDQSGISHIVSSTEGDLIAGNWSNITGVFDKETQDLTVYVNGEQKGIKVLSNVTAIGTATKSALTIGKSQGVNNAYFLGGLDEMKIYSIALSEAVKTDVTLIEKRTARQIAVNKQAGAITPSDVNGIAAYWRVIEGSGDYVYDLAHKGTDFYKNDVKLNGITFSNDIPTASQLGNIAYTDEFGNYSIEAISYNGVGESFNIVPTATLAGAVHEFDPGRKTIFIGEGSKVNNGNDYEDISSFKFSGYIRYDFEDELGQGLKTSGSQGVSLYLDGLTPIAASDNTIYESKADGFFEVEIPIGHHYVEFRKHGHTFDSSKFPVSGTHDFQENVTGVQIVDYTKHSLKGRVVGGKVEGDKLLGMSENPSVNNIGMAEFTLTSEDGKIKRTITTNDTTGEYSIELPPNKYTSSSVKWVKDKADIVSSGDIQAIDLSDITVYNGTYETDSVFVDEKFTRIDSTFYNLRKDFIYRTTPELVVTSLEGGDVKTTGESFYAFNTGIDVSEIKLTDLQFPTYISTSSYAYKLKAVEKYTNKDTDTESTAPVTDGEITISSTVGAGYTLDANGGKVSLGASPEVVSLDVNGEFVYRFNAALPNINANTSTGQEHLSYTKGISMVLNSGDTNTYWPNPSDSNETYKAYILGGQPIGRNFVTEAPSVVDYVLRDPGGSNSYAYWEKGKTVTTTKEYSAGSSRTDEVDNKFGTGSTTLLGGGLAGPGTVLENDATSSLKVGLSREVKAGGEFTESETFSQRIETSSNPIQIGRSDIFVAKSTNIQTGIGAYIRPVPVDQCGGECYGDVMEDLDGNKYQMRKVLQVYSNPTGSPTYFVFSQNHIENVLIPDLEGIRDALFTKVGSTYVSNIDASHSNYGTNNDDPLWGSSVTSETPRETDNTDYSGPSYTYNHGVNLTDDKPVDSIRTVNEQIRLWKEALANNEIAKWRAKKNNKAENISISGGGNSIEKSVTSETSDSFSYSFEISATATAGIETEIKLFGVKAEANFSSEVKITGTTSGSSGTGNTTTTGYVLADDDEDDAISIDVYAADDGGGAIFSTVSGQTSCPFEDKIEMKYATVDYITYKIQQKKKTLDDVQTKLQYRLIVNALVPIVSVLDTEEYTKDIVNLSKEIEDLEALEKALPLGVTLSNATLQRDKPKLLINDAKTAQSFNVPADEAANFNLSLINESESGDAMYYTVKAMDETNPNGLELTVDGQSLNSDREFLVQGNGGISKVLEVRRGPNHYDYENVGIVIKSTCQADPTGNDAVLSDTIYFSAKFLPICTPLEINVPDNNWTLNNSYLEEVDGVLTGSKKFPITVAGYDVNKVGFEKIKIQYKPSSSSEWILLTTYYKDEETKIAKGGSEEDSLLPTNGNSLTYDWIISQTFADGNYDIRAVSGCALAEAETEIFSGIIDTKNPEPFGLPQPSDGILSAGEQASIQFNETINSNLLSAANFDIRGVLNAGEIRHDASVAFDGTSESYVKIESVNMANKAFTIDLYAKKTVSGKDQIFLGQGSDTQTEMLLGFNAQDQFYFKLAGNTITTDKIVDNNWHHYAVSYNPLTTDVTLYIDAVAEQVNNSFEVVNTLSEDVFVGKSATGKPFTGNVHEVRFWSKALTVGEVNSTAVKRMVGNEPGLLYNWKLEEANGNVAYDIVRAKHGIMNATWVVDPVGYSLAFDGVANKAVTDTPIAIDKNTDYTISFWFKSNGGTDEVLLSTGKGDGTDSNASAWSIGVDTAGKVYAVSNGQVFASTPVVTDSKWHHVALVTRVLGNATLYVDAEEQSIIAANHLAGFAGVRFALGQRAYTDVNTISYEDKFFKGNIDEVRVWQTARTLDQISRDRFNKMSGDEPGLIAYYPFETYVESQGVYSVSSSIENVSTSTSKTTSSMVVSGSNSFVNVTPTIKLERPVKSINFSYVVNNDKVILTLNEDSGAIENVRLDFTAIGIKDMNGNTIESPITWSAFVDQNQVVWQDNLFALETENGKKLVFESKIFNNSSESKTFEITNIPQWLSVSPTSGTVGPLTTVPVEFTVSSDVNNGVYTQDLLLSTDFGFAEALKVEVSVKESLPDNWAVNPLDYEHSMNVIGQISINGVLSRNDGNVLGAFVNGECRGLVNLRYLESFDNYQALLSIYSSTSGEELEFKVWEASTGIIYTGVTHTMSTNTFVPNLLEGNSLEPIVFAISESISGNVPVANGWKWISFNLQGDDLLSTNSLMDNVSAQDGNVIKTRLNVLDESSNEYIQKPLFDTYNTESNSWQGTLTVNGAIPTSTLFKVKMSVEDEIYYEGIAVDPVKDQIHLIEGWNYIGYTGTQKIPINEGLNNLKASEGDVIKSQSYLAIYYENFGWIGSLSVLEPNEGYMLRTAVEQDFTYPSFNSTSGTIAGVANQLNINQDIWDVNTYTYPNNMNLVVRLEGEVLGNGVLGVFVEGECRGVASATYNELTQEDVYFVNVAGELEGEELSFKLVHTNAVNTSYYDIKETLRYENDVLVGDVKEPLVLQVDSDSKEILVGDDLNNDLTVYPNPFKKELLISLPALDGNSVLLKFYTTAGKIATMKTIRITSNQAQVIKFQREDLDAGIYFLEIITGSDRVVKKVIVE